MKNLISRFSILVIVIILLVGCSNNQESGSKKDTRTVTTVMGDVEIPLNPQRVVVNWYVGYAISLDLNVVGYYSWAQETMPFYDTLMASSQIENWLPEDVMALEPDLIITYDESDFEKFSKVAPVLVLTESGSSLDRLTLMGEATGRSEKAEEVIKTYETKLDAAKEKLKSGAFAGKTFSILEDWGPSGEWSGIGYETGSRGGTLVYTQLELSYPQKLKELIEETGNGRGLLSYEVAHEYFGDYILWFKQEGKESEYAKTAIWKTIPAVINGNVVEIPGNYLGLFFYDDVVSLTAQLDYIVDAINSIAD